MKGNIIKTVVTCVVGILFFLGCILFNYSVTIKMLDNRGYEFIEYVAGSYKIYDRATKVVYLYSEETKEFHPLFESNGTLVIYKEGE